MIRLIDFFFHWFQDIIRLVDNPIKKTGHIQILYGNVATEGSVAKITGKEGLYFSGWFYSCPHVVPTLSLFPFCCMFDLFINLDEY